jgi:hypothetical protein
MKNLALTIARGLSVRFAKFHNGAFASTNASDKVGVFGFKEPATRPSDGGAGGAGRFWLPALMAAVGIALMGLGIRAAAADSLYIGDGNDNTVKRFDAGTGAFQI